MADIPSDLLIGTSGLSVSDPLEKLRPKRRTHNITLRFTAACGGLKTGQLIKDDNFSLWDAVQALEIMDPKMDSGVALDGDDTEELDLSQDLQDREVIWIMDEILCREMAWLRGFALFQTVFTSRHLLHLLLSYQRTNTIPTFGKDSNGELSEGSAPFTHLCLRAFCLATIIQCDMNIELVTQQDFDEEDLNPSSYGLNLCSQIGDDESLELIDKAALWFQSIEDERNGSDTMTPVEEAIFDRLAIRRIFMKLFMFSEDDTDFANFPRHLERMEMNHDLGREVPGAFDPRAYRKLAIGCPTRPEKKLEFSEMISDLRKLHADFVESSRLRELGPNPSADALRVFLWRFASRTPPPGPLARAKLQASLFSEGGLFDQPRLTQRLMKEMRDLGMQTDVLDIMEKRQTESHPDSAAFKTAKCVQDYIQDSYSALITSARALCQNRCRIRRCLTNSSEEWLELYKRTGLKDGDYGDLLTFTPWYLSTAIARRQAMWIILLGFELQIYKPFEFDRIYGLLAQSIKHHFHAVVSDDDEQSDMFTRAKRYDLEVIQLTAMGFSRVYSVIYCMGLLPDVYDSEITNPQQMWDLRTEPLKGIPDMKGFETYFGIARACRPKGRTPLPMLLKEGQEAFDIANRRLDVLRKDRNYAKHLFDLPKVGLREHIVENTWREDTWKLKKAIIGMLKVARDLQGGMSGNYFTGDTADTINENLIVVHMPSTQERAMIGKDGRPRGHPWWVVPDLRIEKASKLEELD